MGHVGGRYVIDAPEQMRAPDIEALPLREWRCSGVKRDGRPCNNVLNEYAFIGSIKLRKRCDKCGTWNTTQR